MNNRWAEKRFCQRFSIRWSVANAGMSYRYQTGVQFNAYGPERNQNPAHLLDRLIALEQRAQFCSPGGVELRPKAIRHS